MRITGFDYHRNGISGIGFFAFIVSFNEKESKDLRFDTIEQGWGKSFLVTWVPAEKKDDQEVAFFISLDVDGTPQTRNNWRGDNLMYACRPMANKILRAWHGRHNWDKYDGAFMDKNGTMRLIQRRGRP